MKDVYEMTLIAPILRSKTMGQVRSRARKARKDFTATEKAARIPVGEAANVFTRILEAEKQAAARVVELDFMYGRS